VITLFDVIPLVLPLLGVLLGASAGSGLRFGDTGTLALALICGAAGWALGRLPGRLVFRGIQRDLARESTAELRRLLHASDCWIPNHVLVQLRARGEDIRPELPLVLAMMEAAEPHRRAFGFAALLSAFPEFARLARGYNPSQPPQTCALKVRELRLRLGEAP